MIVKPNQLLFRVFSSVWTPRSIPNLIMWMDANDISTLFQDAAGTTPVTADSDPVGKWNDKTANAFHHTQATTANKPAYKTGVLNGRPGLYYDGTNIKRLLGSLGLTKPCSVIIVISGNNQTGGWRGLFQYGGNAWFMYANYNNSSWGSYPTPGAVAVVGDGAPHMLGIIANDLNSDFITDSSTTLNDYARVYSDSSGTSQIGDCSDVNALHAYIHEVVVIGSDATAHLTNLRAYFNSKWGTSF